MLTPEALATGVTAGDRRALARAITLVESARADHQAAAQALLERLLPRTGRARRVGITGVPGAGKSTFIEALGVRLLERGHRVAVLAVDPSSVRSGGSILGDKTRMTTLAADPRAYVRPSPAGGSLGGVARRTREVGLLCEAAGFDVVLVETVGVGQSEVTVASMVDFFLLLGIAGAGDELQGIKRGILEVVDAVFINKADGEGRARAERTAAETRSALRLLRSAEEPWPPVVGTVSAHTGEGVEAVWEAVLEHARRLGERGLIAERRRAQRRQWLRALLDEGLTAALREQPAVHAALREAERAVDEDRITPTAGARDVLGVLIRTLRGPGS